MTAEGKTVSEHRRCPSILRGRNFGQPQSTWPGVIAGLRGWSNMYRLRRVSSGGGGGGGGGGTGVNRMVVNVFENPDCKT